MADNLAVKILISAKDTASGVLNKLKSTSAKVSAAILGFFSVAFFKQATDDAQAFEKQMSTVQAVSGATAEEMRKLEAAAKEMGATTQFTAIESAQALEELARAGLTAAEQVQALPDVLSLAQANGLSLADSAGFITKTIIGLGLSFSDSGKAADVLTKAAASANTNVQGLGSALAYAAPLANTLGLSLEETVGLLAQMANAGIDASRSGTALNSVMAQFIDPASKFKTELAALGINTDNFNDALKQLAEKGGAGNAAILALGTEAGPAIRALFNQGVPALEGLQKSLEDSGGAAKKAADIMSSNLTGAKRQLGSVVDAIKLQLGQPLLKPLTESIRSISSGFTELLNNGVIADVGQSIANSFANAIESGGQLIDYISDIYTELSDNGALTAFSQQFGNAFDATGNLIDTLKGSFVSLFNIVKSPDAPVSFGTAFVSVLTKIIASVTFLVSAFSTGLATIEAAFFGLSGAVASVYSFIIEGVGRVQSAISKITFGDVSKKWQEAADQSKLISESFAKSAEINFEKAGNALGSVSDNVKKFDASILSLTGNVEKSGAVIKETAKDTKELNKDLGDLANTANSAGSEMQVAMDKPKRSLNDLKIAQRAALDEYNNLKNSGTASAEQITRAWTVSMNATDDLLAAVNRTSSGFDEEKKAANNANDAIVAGANSSSNAQADLKGSVDSTTSSLKEQASAAKNAAEAERQLNDEFERNVESNRGSHTNNTEQFEERSNEIRERLEKENSNDGRRPDGQSSTKFSQSQNAQLSELSEDQFGEFQKRLDNQLRNNSGRLNQQSIQQSVDFILSELKEESKEHKKLSFGSEDSGLTQAQKDQIKITEANNRQQDSLGSATLLAFQASERKKEEDRQRKIEAQNKAEQANQEMQRLAGEQRARNVSDQQTKIEATYKTIQAAHQKAQTARNTDTNKIIKALEDSDQRASERNKDIIKVFTQRNESALDLIEKASRLST